MKPVMLTMNCAAAVVAAVAVVKVITLAAVAVVRVTLWPSVRPVAVRPEPPIEVTVLGTVKVMVEPTAAPLGTVTSSLATEVVSVLVC